MNLFEKALRNSTLKEVIGDSTNNHKVLIRAKLFVKEIFKSLPLLNQILSLVSHNQFKLNSMTRLFLS